MRINQIESHYNRIQKIYKSELMTDTRDKEVIKNIQAKTEIINKLEDKASKVLVLQLGSYSIKMGFANEKVPFTIKPYIAYRRIKKSKKQMAQETLPVDQIEEICTQTFKKEYTEIETFLKNEGIIVAEHKPVKGKPRGKHNIALNSYPEFSGNQVLYSEEALNVEDCPFEYTFRKVIKNGQLNIHNNSQEELQACIDDLERLIKYMLKEKMKIPEKEWKTFSCVIVLPDVFIRKHVKNMVFMIFRKIGFNRLYMHLESVLACLGNSISSACVVDIGHEKISVSCVDQGVILPKTLVRKNFGMKHISKTMIKLVNSKINEEGFDLSTSSQSDICQVDQIKEQACSVRQPQQNSNKIYLLKAIREKKQVQIPINYSDAMCISANSIFFNIWNSFQRSSFYKEAFDCNSELYDLQNDPEDLFEEYSGGGHIFEIEADNQNYPKELTDPYSYQPLEELVAASIFSIKENDLRRKFLTNILIIGGGGLLPGLSEELITRVSRIFESEGDDKAQAATDLLSKESDCSHLSWLGGTVLPKLDSLRDLWIEKSKYMGILKEDIGDEDDGGLDKKLFTRKEESQEWGVRYLKEKIPFLW